MALPSVLQGGIAQDLGLAGLRVDLDVDDMEAKAGAGAAGSQIGPADNGAAGRVQSPRQLFERQAPFGITAIDEATLGILDVVGRNLPESWRLARSSAA